MPTEFIINDDIQINLEKSEIHHFKTGRTYPIGSNEAELLRFFISHPNEVITRQVLIDQVWVSKGIFVEDGSLMQAVSICRKALEDKNSEIIITERGKGYRFSGNINNEGKYTPISKLSNTPEKTICIKSNKKINLVTIAIISFISSFLISYFGLKYIENDGLIYNLVIENYDLCHVTPNNSQVIEFHDATLYKYEDMNIIIDIEGQSLSYPNSFKGVNCE